MVFVLLKVFIRHTVIVQWKFVKEILTDIKYDKTILLNSSYVVSIEYIGATKIKISEGVGIDGIECDLFNPMPHDFTQSEVVWIVNPYVKIRTIDNQVYIVTPEEYNSDIVRYIGDLPPSRTPWKRKNVN